jgi:hypothetical protein
MRASGKFQNLPGPDECSLITSMVLALVYSTMRLYSLSSSVLNYNFTSLFVVPLGPPVSLCLLQHCLSFKARRKAIVYSELSMILSCSLLAFSRRYKIAHLSSCILGIVYSILFGFTRTCLTIYQKYNGKFFGFDKFEFRTKSTVVAIRKCIK